MSNQYTLVFHMFMSAFMIMLNNAKVIEGYILPDLTPLVAVFVIMAIINAIVLFVKFAIFVSENYED